MREVSEEEDTGECGDTESDGGKQLGYEGLPKLAVREEVEDTLECVCQLGLSMVIDMAFITLMG